MVAKDGRTGRIVCQELSGMHAGGRTICTGTNEAERTAVGTVAAFGHDFLGPLPSGHNLLVLVDYYSRYIEVDITRAKIS